MDRLLTKETTRRPEITGVLRLLSKHSKFILTFTTVMTLATLSVNLLLPNYYRSTGTLLPTGSTNPAQALGNLASAIPGLEMMNNDPDPTASSKLFPEMLRSDVVRKRVLHAQLPDALAAKMEATTIGGVFSDDPVEALKKLTETTSVGKDKQSGMISLTFEWTDPEFAQFTAAEYIRQLDAFCSSERFARLDESRAFVESRLRDAERRLQAAEDSLLAFREQNRNYYIASAPDLQLEHERLTRKVTEIGQVYALLSQQLEMATIEAKRKKPVVATLDFPSVPEVKSGPQRLVNTLQAAIAALLLSCGFILGRDYMHRVMTPEEANDLRQLRNDWRRQISGVSQRLRLRRKAESCEP
ncbi:MAG: hypothetical protein IT585_03000 [candidate division Zixibacteria bacterium]|nr:hypothetical protein [candidate division Zixibacteria bacterium]